MPQHDIPRVIREDALPHERWDEPAGGLVTVTLVEEPFHDLCQGRSRFEPGACERAHSHNVTQTAYVLGGGGTIRLGLEEHHRASGDMIVIPAEIVHGWRAGPNGLDVLWTYPVGQFDEVVYAYEE